MGGKSSEVGMRLAFRDVRPGARAGNGVSHWGAQGRPAVSARDGGRRAERDSNGKGARRGASDAPFATTVGVVSTGCEEDAIAGEVVEGSHADEGSPRRVTWQVGPASLLMALVCFARLRDP